MVSGERGGMMVLLLNNDNNMAKWVERDFNALSMIAYHSLKMSNKHSHDMVTKKKCPTNKNTMTLMVIRYRLEITYFSWMYVLKIRFYILLLKLHLISKHKYILNNFV